MSGLSSTQIDDLVDAYARRLVDSMTHQEMEFFIHDNCIETFRYKPQEEIFDDIHLNLGGEALNELLKEINVSSTLETL